MDASAATRPILGTGVYDVATASRLLGIDDRTLVRWAHPDKAGRPALVPPTHGWAFSFHDLLSLAVIAVLRQGPVTPMGVRRAVEFLRQRFQVPRPLAHKRIVDALRTAGNSLLLPDEGWLDITAGGQFTIFETVERYLAPIEYGHDQLARLWRPAPLILVNPAVQAGLPCLEGTRVTTDVLAGRFIAGESYEDIADDLMVSAEQVRAAVVFERDLEEGKGLALVT